jgi:hypothetical protein
MNLWKNSLQRPLKHPMNHHPLGLALAASLALSVLLSACVARPIEPANTEPPKAALQFVDLQGFDRELASSLSATLPTVDVAFYDRVSPSALPPRLQSWMASVEAGGGSVKVVPPPSTVAAKSPLLLLGLVTSLWTASKMAREMSSKAQLNVAKDYDANILLKTDDKGESVVDKVVFVKRKK